MSRRSNRNDFLYNTFDEGQIDYMIAHWMSTGALVLYNGNQPLPAPGMILHQWTWSCNSHGYPQSHILKEWIDLWEAEYGIAPYAVGQAILVHPIYWRWQNDYRFLNEKTELSHLWKGRPDIFLCCEEDWKLNESRKWCMYFDWWRHPNKPGVCNHNPKCWGDTQ